MHITNEQIKEFLIDSGLVSKIDFLSCEKRSGEDVDITNTLISEGKITESDSARMKSYILGVPFVDFDKEKISYDKLSLIPESISRKHNAVAFGKEDNKIKVACIDPNSISEIMDSLNAEHVIPYITNIKSIKKALVEYQKGLQHSFGDDIRSGAIKIKNNEGEIDDHSSIRFVDTILRHAVVQNASIIHIENDSKSVIVRYRVKGRLYDAMTLPVEVMLSLVNRINVLSGGNNGGFKFTTEDGDIYISSNTQNDYKKIVLKLYSDSDDMMLEKLNFQHYNIEKIHKYIHSKNGMILVTGPVKSGKTTTMYSILDIINSPSLNIVTIEDKIEKDIKRVNQVKVLDSEKAMYLRSVPGQDADIVMVSNINNAEEMSLMTNLSLTNHLVVSSVSSESASECLYKVLNNNIDPFAIKNSLKIIIGQKTMRKLDDNKEKYYLSSAGITSLGKIINLDEMLEILKDKKIVDANATWKKVPFYKPKKIKNSNGGYQGRVGVQEVLEISETIKDLIMSGANVSKFEEQAKKEGMITLLEDGIIKAVMGLTTLEEVLRVIAK